MSLSFFHLFLRIFLLSRVDGALAILDRTCCASVDLYFMHALISLLLILSCWLHAEAGQYAPGDPFEQGLKAYQSKQYDQAREAFEKALQAKPNDAAIMYNLGLTYFQENRKGYAVGYWRKALSAAPGLTGASLGSRAGRRSFSLQSSGKNALGTDASLRIRPAHLEFLVVLAGAFDVGRRLALARFLLKSEEPPLKKTIKRRQAWGPRLSRYPFAWVLAASLNMGKWLDESKARGTVVSSNAELKAAPSDDGVALATVPEASEIAIHQAHEGWVQVTTSDGAAGWLKKTDVLSSGKDL